MRQPVEQCGVLHAVLSTIVPLGKRNLLEQRPLHQAGPGRIAVWQERTGHADLFQSHDLEQTAELVVKLTLGHRRRTAFERFARSRRPMSYSTIPAASRARARRGNDPNRPVGCSDRSPRRRRNRRCRRLGRTRRNRRARSAAKRFLLGPHPGPLDRRGRVVDGGDLQAAPHHVHRICAGAATDVQHGTATDPFLVEKAS